jgi:CDP-diacylglycerol--serine O-phosphatidyltransferase
MVNRHLNATLRFCLPQSITSLRILLSGWALFAAISGNAELVALLVILGIISDGFDGSVARKLDVASDFGALFDYFADYLCFIVVPSILCFLMLDAGASRVELAVLLLPLLAGAIRYSRMDGLRRIQSFDELGYPGLSTVLYTCFVVALFFLAHQGFLSERVLSQLLWGSVPVLSVLMLAPVRYPKLVKSKTVLLPILVGLGLMPFVLTTVLAVLTVAVVMAYVVFSPLLISQRPELSSRGSNANSSTSPLSH